MNRTQIPFISAVLLLLFIRISGCIFAKTPPEDNSFLEPIPEATLQAFQFGYTIETRLQAVIAGRRELEASTRNYTNIPQVVSVEELKYARALSRVGKTVNIVEEDLPDNMKVWLVVFLCEVQLPSPTPEPAQNCTYVILNVQDGHALLLGSRTDCKSLYEW